jgi:hypothetical protein
VVLPEYLSSEEQAKRVHGGFRNVRRNSIGVGLALDATPAGSFGKRHADERRPYI